MTTSPSNSILQSLNIEDLAAYLDLTGWDSISKNKQWFVFQGSNDVQGKSIEIVFPNNPKAPDLGIYLASAINTIAAVKDQNPEEVIQKIRCYDRDILKISTFNAEIKDSLPIFIASRQVSQLKSLIAFSACSEEDAKPHFNTQLRTAKRMTEHYRFGHTFRGSFGYTIESPLVGSTGLYIQKSLNPEYISDYVILPLERRVMERIVRGLLITQRAVENRSVDILIQEYPNGFNANMCRAITDMVKDTKEPVEYAVEWSPKLQVDNDLSNISSIRMNDTSYTYLKEAATKLRELKPEYVSVEGLVTELSSRNNPLSTTISDRSVIIRWQRSPNRTLNLRIVLNREEYIIAHKAHLNWNTIQVDGVLQNLGGMWRLSEPHNFKIIR